MRGLKTAETNANSEVLQYAYGPAGDLLSLTDAKGHTTRRGYSAVRGRPDWVVAPG